MEVALSLTKTNDNCKRNRSRSIEADQNITINARVIIATLPIKAYQSRKLIVFSLMKRTEFLCS